MIKIAILLTCFNRKDKTLSCLKNVAEAAANYNILHPKDKKIELVIYLTNDGCTDGTADSVIDEYGGKIELHIINGTGNLYWAGGMRAAWREAIKHPKRWNYYLLLNDDTDVVSDAFDILFSDEEFIVHHYGKKGAISGITYDKADIRYITYGGTVITNKFFASGYRIKPSGRPQKCDIFNANILIVPSEIVEVVGMFYNGFIHAHADGDYSKMISKLGYPVMVSSEICGSCEFDHPQKESLASKLCNMSLMERKNYFDNPIHSYKDYLTFIKRNYPWRYPLVWIGNILSLYFPKIYFALRRQSW